MGIFGKLFGDAEDEQFENEKDVLDEDLIRNSTADYDDTVVSYGNEKNQYFRKKTDYNSAEVFCHVRI